MKPIRILIGVAALALLAVMWFLREPVRPSKPATTVVAAKETKRLTNLVQYAPRTKTVPERKRRNPPAPNTNSFPELPGDSLTSSPTNISAGATGGSPTPNADLANAPKEKPPLVDPLARIALFFVGADPLAEEVWLDAINNPDLPSKERQDLIEDLNEFGLRDPKHPTAEDLPLIVSRLILIEMVGPDAMDKVNADAFREAYKDLANLADIAMGGGVPVK